MKLIDHATRDQDIRNIKKRTLYPYPHPFLTFPVENWTESVTWIFVCFLPPTNWTLNSWWKLKKGKWKGMRESCLVYCYSGIQSLFEVVLLYKFYTFPIQSKNIIIYIPKSTSPQSLQERIWRGRIASREDRTYVPPNSIDHSIPTNFTMILLLPSLSLSLNNK